METCADSRKNIGKTTCTVMPELPKCMITVPDNFEATEEEIGTLTFWANKILAAKSSRIYLFPDFVDFKDVSDKATYESTPLADIAAFQGKFKYDIAIRKDLCTHRAMFTHKMNGGRVIIWDVENQFIMTKKSNGKFTGMKISLLNPEKLMIGDGKNATKSPVHLVLADHKELDGNGYAFDVSDFVNELMPLTDLNLEIIATDTGDKTISLKLTASCDGSIVPGMVEADFSVFEADGDDQPITALVDNGDGTYLITCGGGLVTGYINMRASSLLTVKGYELPAAVDFVVA